MGDVHFKSFIEENSRYKLAVAFFSRMHNFGKMWNMFVPAPPFSRSDMMFMGHICRMKEKNERLPASMLADSMGQTSAAVSQKIRFLEEHKLIKRISDEKDRRITLVEPTEKGKKMAAAQMNEFFGKLESVLNEIGKEDTLQLIGYFDKFSQVIEKRVKLEAEAEAKVN